MTQVESFGVQWEGPTAWLLQGRKGSNFIGLGKKCPFENPGGMCNHLFPVASPIPDRLHWEAFLRVFDDPLVQAMMPVPNSAGRRAYYLEDPYDDLSLYLSCLSRLSSPILPVVKPAWSVSQSEIKKQLFTSNVQPWVLTRMDPKGVDTINQIAELTNYAPRTVLVSGDATVPVPKEFSKVQTQIRDFPIEDLVTLPLEAIGVTILRRYARKENLGAPMESREDRRERIHKDRNNST